MAPTFPSPFQERFAEAVEAARREGINQKQLSKEIGCSKNMIRLWRTGEHRPQHHHVQAIAEVLGIPAQELFEKPAERRPSPAGSPDPQDLLHRLTELELEAVLRKVQEAKPHLKQLDELLPSLMTLLAEAKLHVDETGAD